MVNAAYLFWILLPSVHSIPLWASNTSTVNLDAGLHFTMFSEKHSFKDFPWCFLCSLYITVNIPSRELLTVCEITHNCWPVELMYVNLILFELNNIKCLAIFYASKSCLHMIQNIPYMLITYSAFFYFTKWPIRLICIPSLIPNDCNIYN